MNNASSGSGIQLIDWLTVTAIAIGLALVWLLVRQIWRDRGSKSAKMGHLVFTSEWAASAAAAAIRDHGIDAQVMGGFSAGNRAEAPGLARVILAADDLEDPNIVLEGLKAKQEDFDWDEVDVGPHPEEFDECPGCGYTLDAGRSVGCPECGWQRIQESAS